MGCERLPARLQQWNAHGPGLPHIRVYNPGRHVGSLRQTRAQILALRLPHRVLLDEVLICKIPVSKLSRG